MRLESNRLGDNLRGGIVIWDETVGWTVLRAGYMGDGKWVVQSETFGVWDIQTYKPSSVLSKWNDFNTLV